MRLFPLFLVLSFLGLSACTTTSAPEVGYYDGKPITIRAEVEPGLVDSNLNLYIQDELVVNQRSKAFGGSSQSFKGSWRGKPVIARATKIENFLSSYTQIDVFIAGQLVETLTV